MTMRHWYVSWLIACSISSAAAAQTVELSEAPLADSCCRVRLALDLKGKITFQQQGKMETAPHEAVAEHDFVERVLAAKGTTADKTARIYQVARATIAGQSRSLRAERALMIAQRIKDQLVTYSPGGPLFGAEMELMEHFDTLALPGLLPGKEVKVGDSWVVPPAVVQALCGLDALDAQIKQELTCELKAVQGDLALVSIQGIVKGIQLGAAVSIHVDATSRLTFNLKHKRIVELVWRQSDERKQGPATPNLSADVAIRLQRTPVETPKELGPLALVVLPEVPPARLTNIVHDDAKATFRFQHSREWQNVGEHNGRQVLKLMTARGDHLADAIVMPWKGPKIGNAQAFKEQMDATPGWQQEGEAQLDAAVKHPGGYTVYRVSAAGKLEGVPAFRMAYLLTGGAGQQLLVTFVAPPSQVSNLEARDQALVDSFEFK